MPLPISGTVNAEQIDGTIDSDVINGLDGNDTINGLVGGDTLYGDAGDDLIDGGDDSDDLHGGDGNDTIYGQGGTDTIHGDAGNDSLYAQHYYPSADFGGLIDGGSGNDDIFALTRGLHTLIGGTGSDYIAGYGSAVIYGDLQNLSDTTDAGDDTLFMPSGYNGIVSAYAGAGNDTIRAAAADTAHLEGNEGDDQIRSESNRQSTILGGAGDDTITVELLASVVRPDLVGTDVDGGAGNDTITVNGDMSFLNPQARITLAGGDGNDVLSVDESAADTDANHALAWVTLDGGGGNDVLSISGGLQVQLTGGGGADTFKVTAEQYLTMQLGTRQFINTVGSTTAVTADALLITDFQAGTGGDVLDLNGLLAGAASGYATGTNPFETGYLSALQNGLATEIRFDPDGAAGSSASVVVIARLQGVDAAGLVAANFSPAGYQLSNQPPTATDRTLTLDEDTSRAITVTDFGFADANAGDVLTSVRITTLPTQGQLLLNGSAITAGQTIVAASVAAGQLVFRPASDANNGTATSYAQLTFTVSDGALSSAAHTLTFDVRPVNDAPVWSGVTSPALSVAQGQTLAISNGILLSGWSDVDAGDVLAVQSPSASAGSLVASGDGWNYTAPAGSSGAVTLNYSVSDGHGGIVAATRAITVIVPDNQAPVLTTPMADQQAAQGWAFTAQLPDGMFTDAEDTSLTLTARLANGGALPSWLRFDATTRTFSGTPSGTDAGVPSRNFDIVVTATDRGGKTATDTFVLSVFGSRIVNGTGSRDNLVGNIANETIIAGAGDDTLSGGAGHDRLLGDAGNDRLSGDIGNDMLIGGLDHDTLSGGAGQDSLLGESGKDSLSGGDDNDFLWGGADADTLDGGSGNDSLGGEAGNDTLLGGDGADTLDGGAGGDSMQGGAGDDLYVFDVAGDMAIEAAGEGFDTVRTSFSMTLAENLEGLTLSLAASAPHSSVTGNAADNRLIGDSFNNTLDGRAGADTMAGGFGNDTYVIDDAGDVIEELSGQGIDTVRSSIDFVLSGTLEHLVLTGSALNGTGNTVGNKITGNALVNRLDGGAGNDTLDGGENNDYLIGGSGTDSMVGGPGDDTYVVDMSSDITLESVGGGVDLVLASASLTLFGNIENLTLIGSTNISGTGNTESNRLQGNDGNNVLRGMVGADTLAGGKGSDTLTGGAGADTFVFDTPLGITNVDQITDMVATGSVQDHFWLDDGIFTAFAGRTAIDPAMLRAGAGLTTAITAAHRLIYNSSTGDLYYDADGTGGTAAVKFAILAGVPLSALSADDFIVG